MSPALPAVSWEEYVATWLGVGPFCGNIDTDGLFSLGAFFFRAKVSSCLSFCQNLFLASTVGTKLNVVVQYTFASSSKIT